MCIRDRPAEDNSASLQREIVETRAQLAAYKECVRPEAVEDVYKRQALHGR